MKNIYYYVLYIGKILMIIIIANYCKPTSLLILWWNRDKWFLETNFFVILTFIQNIENDSDWNLKPS